MGQHYIVSSTVNMNFRSTDLSECFSSHANVDIESTVLRDREDIDRFLITAVICFIVCLGVIGLGLYWLAKVNLSLFAVVLAVVLLLVGAFIELAIWEAGNTPW